MVRTLRSKQGLTQVELAKRARIGQAYIAMLERGDRKNPSLPVLKRLAKALGVSVTELLE
jgi:transcriptional regulator with XRE-family HTH domain